MTTLTYTWWSTCRLILFVVAFRCTSGSLCAGQAPLADKAQIRAAMIINLTQYVDWPAWKFIDSAAPYVLCFLPNETVGDYAELLVRDREGREKSVQNNAALDRNITVRRVSSVTTMETCHVFYVSSGDRRKLVEASPTLVKASVLTIGDQVTLSEGPVIALPLVESRVQILIDLRVAQQSGLTVSSKLLKIAVVTR